MNGIVDVTDRREAGLAMRRLPTRRWIVTRTEFAIGVLAALVFPFLAVASPSYMGGGMRPPGLLSDLLSALPVAIGIVGVVVGLAWMVRILRQDPESGPSHWRYRSPDDPVDRIA